jgi:hypothetical protein
LDQEGDKVEILLEKVQLDKPFWEPDEWIMTKRLLLRTSARLGLSSKIKLVIA